MACLIDKRTKPLRESDALWSIWNENKLTCVRYASNNIETPLAVLTEAWLLFADKSYPQCIGSAPNLSADI